jgi:hypothetical protein
MSEKIAANPSKDFFISMLTRDISLLSAIIDLVDNSVDAALSAGSYSGRFVKLTLSSDQFVVVDNCGGIPLEAAKDYAFKFGRPSDAPLTPHSVGRFGVGMKRALFKIGEAFSVLSHHADDSFEVDVNVNEWIKEPGDWLFDMNLIDPSSENGTTIIVNNLHLPVAENFSDEVFLATLEAALERAHYRTLKEGFDIYVNEKKIGLHDITVYSSDDLGISSKSIDFGDVLVVIKAGVGERDFHEGGWNVLCNNRLIEGSNKGVLTGWGVDGLRTYHPDFAFFRGVVEFSSANGDLLPWNTTKTGIDIDNPVYRSALVEMKRVMRPVIELLKDRVKEQENLDNGLVDVSPVNDAMSPEHLVSIFQLPVAAEFIRPAVERVHGEVTHRRISYSVCSEELTQVKEAIGAASNKQVGELTFKYYMENEL